MLGSKNAREGAQLRHPKLYIATLRQQGAGYGFAISDVSGEKPLISGLNVDFNAALIVVYGLLSSVRRQQQDKACTDYTSPSALHKIVVAAGVVVLAALAWMILH